RPLVAGELLVGGITSAWSGTPQTIDAIPCSQRIRGSAKVVGERRVVIHLLGGVIVEADVLALAESPVQRESELLVDVVGALAATAESQSAFVLATIRVIYILVFGQGCITLIACGAQ